MRFVSKYCGIDPQSDGFVDLTPQIQEVVGEAGIHAGRVTVSSTRPDCFLLLNENESGLRTDFAKMWQRSFAEVQSGPGIAHSSVVLPIIKGTLWTGAWQRVLAFVTDKHTSDEGVVIQAWGIDPS